MTRDPGSTVYNDAIQTATTMRGITTKAEKRDADTMNSSTSSLGKRQRTDLGFVDLGVADAVQKKTKRGSRAEGSYLDVLREATTSLRGKLDLGPEPLGSEYAGGKHHVLMPKPVRSIAKNRPPPDSLAVKVLRKMASKYATPSTSLARFGSPEYQSSQSLADNLPLDRTNDEAVRAHGPLEPTPDLSTANASPRHHDNTATASKRQPVEHAWPTGRKSSGGFARRPQQPDSNTDTLHTAVDLEREALRKELDELSKGLTPQSVTSSRLFWPNPKIPGDASPADPEHPF